MIEGKSYLVTDLQFSWEGFYSGPLEVSVLKESKKALKLQVGKEKYWFLRSWGVNIIEEL
jgi:hypothetical protein